MDLDVLERAGVATADAVVVATDGDNTNLVVAQVIQTRYPVRLRRHPECSIDAARLSTRTADCERSAPHRRRSKHSPLLSARTSRAPSCPTTEDRAGRALPLLASALLDIESPHDGASPDRAGPPRGSRSCRLLRGLDAVTNVVHLPGAGLEPAGDVVLCYVAREEVSLVVERLTALGLYREGSIALEAVDASVSLAAQAAMERAPGSPADAVLWEQVEQTAGEHRPFGRVRPVHGDRDDDRGRRDPDRLGGAHRRGDGGGPEFGPLAALCLAIVRRRPRVAHASIVALVVGFAIAIAASLTLTAARARA